MLSDLALLASLALSAFDSADVAAKPGGKIKIDYGSPMWKDEFAAQLTPGFTWRLGANSATTLTTEAGMVFDDLVLFPGTYNVAAVVGQEQKIDLVFHHDGIFLENKSTEGRTPCEVSELKGKDVAKKLTMELKKAKERYEWRIAFGPKGMVRPFQPYAAKKAKGKAGATAFELVWLERTDLEECAKRAADGAVCVARLAVKEAESPHFLLLRAGQSPEFVLSASPDGKGGTSVKAEAAPTAKAAKALTCIVAAEGDEAVVTVSLGANAYTAKLGAGALGG